MNTRQAIAVTLGLIFLALPMIATNSFALGTIRPPVQTGDFSHPSPQYQVGQIDQNMGHHQLSLSLSGMVVNAGSQIYNTEGGSLGFASVMGEQINASSARLEYSYEASVSGLSTKGRAFIKLVGTTLDGQQVTLSVKGAIGGSIPAASFPLGCVARVNCTSFIPAMFLGEGIVSVSIGSTLKSSYSIPLELESAYLNPWGAPIILAALDNSFVIVSSYSEATIQWRNVEIMGLAKGTFDSNPVSGSFAMRVNSFENLVSGVERDSGSVSLFAFSNSVLDANGEMHGTSIIPTSGSYPCSGGSMPQGTCTMTGLISSGNLFISNGKDLRFVGTYYTIWNSPALAFESSVQASSPPAH